MSKRHPHDPYQAATGAEMDRCAEDHGFEFVRQTGGHAIYRHPVKKRMLVIPRHLSPGVKRVLAAAILASLLVCLYLLA